MAGEGKVLTGGTRGGRARRMVMISAVCKVSLKSLTKRTHPTEDNVVWLHVEV